MLYYYPLFSFDVTFTEQHGKAKFRVALKRKHCQHGEAIGNHDRQIQ